MSSDDSYRHYQIRWARIIARAVYVALGLIMVVLVLGNAYDARHCADCDHSFPVGTAVSLGMFGMFVLPLVAVRRDGTRVPVPGLVEGRRMVWDGGQTYHIVDVLNERRQARLARADDASEVLRDELR